MADGLTIYRNEASYPTIGTLVAAAEQRLDPALRDYVAGGASGERTLADNVAAFGAWRFRGRMLAGIGRPDLSTTLLGAPLALPVFTSPFGYDEALHPDGHTGVARAAARHGVLHVAPEGSSRPIEEIAAAGAAGMLQLTLVGPDSHVLGLIERAAAAGYRAVCFTDAPMRAWRERMRAARLDLMPEYGLGNYGDGRADLAVLRELVAFTEPRWDWDRLRTVAARSPLPWLLKGVLTAEEARRAVDAGAAGVYVSNYGGRDVDGLPATLDALPEVADAVGGAVPVLFDGGVRRGTDIAVALALGASAVGVGRLAAWALAADGEDGVSALLDLLAGELAAVVGGLGYDRIDALGRDLVRPARDGRHG
ncbi:MAG TPA: alpha-hydroxy acid oxidase [Actinocatenispora sp.]